MAQIESLLIKLNKPYYNEQYQANLIRTTCRLRLIDDMEKEITIDELQVRLFENNGESSRVAHDIDNCYFIPKYDTP
jgi:hypothetical protein